MAQRAKSNRDDLTHDEVDRRLHYEETTGIFRWKEAPPNQRIYEGYIAGSNGPRGYWWICLNGHQYLSHRLAVLVVKGAWPAHEVDHINGIRNNNRWVNLRECVHLQNGQNRSVSANNKSGAAGVYQTYDSNRWWAEIKVKGDRLYLGSFDEFDQAVEARRRAEQKHFGEFQRVAP